jgi:hypothetical protein
LKFTQFANEGRKTTVREHNNNKQINYKYNFLKKNVVKFVCDLNVCNRLLSVNLWGIVHPFTRARVTKPILYGCIYTTLITTLIQVYNTFIGLIDKENI